MREANSACDPVAAADVRHKRRSSMLRFWSGSLQNRLSSKSVIESRMSAAMDRDSLDRSSSELAVDPTPTSHSVPNSGNDPALGGGSPREQQVPGLANDPFPAVESVLQSDVGASDCLKRSCY